MLFIVSTSYLFEGKPRLRTRKATNVATVFNVARIWLDNSTMVNITVWREIEGVMLANSYSVTNENDLVSTIGVITRMESEKSVRAS